MQEKVFFAKVIKKYFVEYNLNDIVQSAHVLAKFKVTIGVCVRNGEDNIRDAVESVISQDFPHEFMEVIFVDDGSTDKTLSTIENHSALIS
jgi:cellulose synthase/poly-beta-1,6-N-acetylglucosamine synthase-like glycosyltransferase